MTRLTLCFAIAGAVWLLGPAESFAQSLGFGQQGDGPIQIEAEDGIEWQRANQVYVASGNARATQGSVSVQGDELIAHYKPSATGENEIYRINANGNVRITSDSEVAQSDNAVYDIDNGVLVLTGDTVRLDTAEDTIIARDSL